MTTNETPQTLFVAWQDPQSRRFWPVARLVQLPDNRGGCWYEFCYIRAAHEALEQQFQPFLGFPELDRVYRSRELFPLFANRLMSPSRMDYPQYIECLGLGPESTEPMSVLARSGGRRTTDAVELFPLPTFDDEFGGYRTFFLAHAIRHLSDLSRERVLQLARGDRLRVMLDCQNDVDPDAIALRTDDRIIVGYMPGYLLEDAHELVGACAMIEVFVERINPPPAPLQHRLLCRVHACWPDDFVPLSTPRYQPISSEAAPLPRQAFIEG